MAIMTVWVIHRSGVPIRFQRQAGIQAQVGRIQCAFQHPPHEGQVGACGFDNDALVQSLLDLPRFWEDRLGVLDNAVLLDAGMLSRLKAATNNTRRRSMGVPNV